MADSARASDDRARLAALGLCLALAASPFALVTVPPATDLAQHAAQVRLLEEQLGLAPITTSSALYEVRWGAPNTLVYGWLFLWRRLLPPVVASKVAWAGLALLAVAATHALARARRRPIAQAMIASIPVFGLSLHWGFAAFMLGSIAALLALDAVLRPPDPERPGRDAAKVGALLLFVYLSHALFWAALFAAWLASAAGRGRPFAKERLRALAIVPVAAHAAFWLPRLEAEYAAAGVAVEARWVPLAERLSPGYVTDTLLGGLAGPEAVVALVVVLGWVLAGILGRAASDGELDRPLALFGAALLAFVAGGPDHYANTLLFAPRFGGPALTVLILATPSPPLRAARATAAAALLTVAFFGTTAHAWWRHDREELTGLEASLRAEPGPARVLGLAFTRQSEHVGGRPFMHLAAWRAALYGGELGFDFTEFRTGIVARRDVRRITWSQGLEWSPERATARDLSAFDLVLVTGEPVHHEATRRAATPLVASGRVRLNRVRRGSRAPAAVSGPRERGSLAR